MGEVVLKAPAAGAGGNSAEAAGEAAVAEAKARMAVDSRVVESTMRKEGSTSKADQAEGR